MLFLNISLTIISVICFLALIYSRKENYLLLKEIETVKNKNLNIKGGKIDNEKNISTNTKNFKNKQQAHLHSQNDLSSFYTSSQDDSGLSLQDEEEVESRDINRLIKASETTTTNIPLDEILN